MNVNQEIKKLEKENVIFRDSIEVNERRISALREYALIGKAKKVVRQEEAPEDLVA